MAREIQITPRRIQYVQEKEADVCKNLMTVASEKQKEITHVIEVTLQEMREGLIEIAAVYQYRGTCFVCNSFFGMRISCQMVYIWSHFQAIVIVLSEHIEAVAYSFVLPTRMIFIHRY
jgi:hypothetical protein